MPGLIKPVRGCDWTRADSLPVLAAEVGMARRRIGQEDVIARPEPRAASSLTQLAALLDWGEIDRALAGASAAVKGEFG